ncbi:AAA family ATPase [Ruminococcus flavefaciens]|uniref:AAA family ATPase n=1 Tax=Ruminococcus flavefaciens TaxID=1265 RepID=UPI0026EDD3D9|nr:AAA family ATPase [Ruminococcus flavefaciens]MDD7515728.1 AAA family ATPase [Ruminococcus flavefaciens]MDY5692806.1 AAA family ATPase [Ruminococcus flavefaciens]
MSNMLQTKTAEEILTTVFKPKEFIIDGLLTQGLYVLAGAQKVGKSWLAMDICVSALQQEFLYSDVILFRESQDTAESEEAVDIDEADDEAEEETLSQSM